MIASFVISRRRGADGIASAASQLVGFKTRMKRQLMKSMMKKAFDRNRVVVVAAAIIATGLMIAAGAGFAVSSGDAKDSAVSTITAEALRARLAETNEKPLLVDVREPSEFDAARIEGALLAPLATVEKSLESTDRGREIVLVCRSGRRSAKAYETLARRGFTSMKNLEGGMLAWEERGYPVVKKKE